MLFYGLTPPKSTAGDDKIRDIAGKQIERIKDIAIDGLILYDIQDESSRTDVPRPFPFMPTLAPDFYSETYLADLTIPKIVYKSVGKCTTGELKDWIKQKENTIECAVFVGAPSRNQSPTLSLVDAYRIKQASNSPMILGGITIPERHDRKDDEHLRIIDKIDRGCGFFISQCVYSTNNSKNLLSDYYYASVAGGRETVPVVFTLTPCGSLKTLEFMKWLGIDIPKWLNNDLLHSNDILLKSVDVCKKIAVDLVDYSISKDIPIGFNIESVSVRKEEIEASIELLKEVKSLLECV